MKQLTSCHYSKGKQMDYDLNIYKKTTDIMSLRNLLESKASECNVILRVKENFDLDFVKVRSYIVGGLVTATIATEDLIKLESSSDVISYNVAKALQSY